MRNRAIAEPYKIKVIEPIHMLEPVERAQAIREAGYNTFLLRSVDVYIDLLTDSGTSAMSDRQWAGMMLGDEAYAGSRNFYHLEDAMRDIYGFKHLVPTHQGRAAEHILSSILIKRGQIVPMNMYFTTTREHVELAGGVFVDVITPEAHDPANPAPFKGNIDMDRLRKVVHDHGVDQIAYISYAPCVNMAGGQPFSMANCREVCAFAHENGIPVYFDATRAVENCYFIQQREEGYADKGVRAILKEMMSHGDGCTMSSKKDNLVNIGGFLATNDEDVHTDAKAMVVVYEGLHTYGGLAGRDMEAMACGMYEMVEDDYIAFRVRQVEYLGAQLAEAGVPIVHPVGGHAVFLDAKALLRDLPQDRFPAQALAAALYEDSGVRGMERGVISAGRDLKSGQHRFPRLELVRLTIPRRVYTNSHMDVVAESVIHLKDHIDDFPVLKKGLSFTYEPAHLRFFQARFTVHPD